MIAVWLSPQLAAGIRSRPEMKLLYYGLKFRCKTRGGGEFTVSSGQSWFATLLSFLCVDLPAGGNESLTDILDFLGLAKPLHLVV